MRRFLFVMKILGGVVIVLSTLLIVAFFLFNNSFVQQKLLSNASEVLSERVGSKVAVDSTYVNVLEQQVKFFNIDIEDQHQRKMFKIKEVAANTDLMALRKDQVKFNSMKLKGMDALLLNSDSDSVANFKFFLEAFKKKESADSHAAEKKSDKKKKSLNIDNVEIEDINVQYNDNHYHLGSLVYNQDKKGRQLAKIKNLTTQLRSHTKKGEMDVTARVDQVIVDNRSGKYVITLDTLHFDTDNHLPRKNHNRPKRGAFDNGHLHVKANLKIVVDHYAKDSLVATVTGTAFDKESGIDLRNISFRVAANKRVACLYDILVQQGWTTVKIPQAIVQLPSKKENRPLFYTTSDFVAHVFLQDISKPFAPVLKNFVKPLQVVAQMNGTDDAMTFKNVRVNTSDKKLNIKASGVITNLKDARKLEVKFNVPSMYARGNSKEEIISQFPVKKLMMKQLKALGDITYSGNFSVLWRKELFGGLLHTNVGDVNFNFTIDDENKYVTGTVSSNAINVGKTFDLPDIGTAYCKADFKVDISKPRTARMRRLKGGKLPIGHANAYVADVTYKKFIVRNVNVDVTSDGAIAQGSLRTNGRHMDLSCNFSFTSTEEMKKMKISKPGIKFHKLSEEDRMKKAEEKELKKQKKAEEKAQRELEKEREKALRQQEEERQ